ncbi:putative transmembrane alanine and glycine rich protein [Mycobacterium lentiflavum]|uniref:Putative transmembrane alanine and glycine rich protein n=1 Tax=Mycobacterium lentiflavum TaxID=141349 RepID=A0A0E4CMU2_MYCLN|nr:putative transmembrane alanine and glycine rich protein [Mycobacterium lentiflavum]
MNGKRGHVRRLAGRALVSVATTALAIVLLAPTVSASPIGDAEAAIMAEWSKAGGDTSPLGPRKGDVYPVADGFACDFDGGKFFFTTATGAKFIYGPILEKYDMLGGAAGGDLGFPTINEVPGLAGPDSRVATFSASDKPVIYWTPDHGAFVVRGALNAAWDKLGSSGGVLGAPVGDETYDGEVSSQKFSGGQISWNRKTKEFTTEPANLAEQLKGLQVAIDPTAAINMAWRAAGGVNGPLGAKQGGPNPIGGDGIVQNFAGGKVFFSPATGASALESDILAKYESVGGPVNSDLGFPTANESDGGVSPNSRIATFSGADKPVIFWTSDHGAFVVRGAMKAAWDKLRGPTGKLGAPVGDQTVDGDVISQKFTGGKISWNRAKNTFSTDPANLAPLLSGLQVSGQNQPSGSALPAHAKKWFTWSWWYLFALVPLVILVLLAVFVALRWRRHRAGRNTAPYDLERDVDVGGYQDTGEPHWGPDYADGSPEHMAFTDTHEPDHRDDEHALLARWPHSPETAEMDEDGGYDEPSHPLTEEEWDELAVDERDPDSVDTDSIPVVSADDLSDAGYGDELPEAGYPDSPDVPERAYPDVVVDDEYADAAGPEAAYLPEAGYPPEGGYPEAGYPELLDEDAAYPEAGYPRADEEEARYPDVAVPHTPPDLAGAGGAASGAAAAGGAAAGGPAASLAAALGAASGVAPRAAGRHAAADADDEADLVPVAAIGALSPAGRPTIHLPLEDPYQIPDGYPIKASARFGLYYTPDSDLYHDTLAEIWLSSEEAALLNGFTKAD